MLDTGVLLHIRETLPKATIHLFHGASNSEMVPLLPVAVEAHLCDFTNVPSTLRALRRAQLDVLLDLTPWPRLTAIYCSLSGAVTVGFRSHRQLRHFAYDIAIPHLRDRHEVENLQALADAFGKTSEYCVQLRSNSIAASMPLAYEQLVLCHIAPGGTRAAEKSWPAEYWAELVRRLVSLGYSLGFTGTAADVSAVNAVLAAAAAPPERAFSLCGQISLLELTRMLKSARLLITVDTGVLHLASTVAVPMIALHGPTASGRWGARNRAARSLNAPHPSAGFVHFGFEHVADGLAIMRSLSVDAVLEAATSMLASEPQKN